ncbi:type II toxin-antitoxin system toxin DNA ADP-ribosyl transferase DarT [Klebsiella michiganensis]|nr:DUF4433 domain-containing protein [Klebsiella michiganensis]ECF7065234.1 DUF4433 domain-containing protein [Salmonella enterica subsp. enterica]EDT7312285.1 DUF4433 domain-containing protein [Salmonella enterica subsp. enterica]HEJ8620405.1 DUF4433 domain-containing protein [Klebsiella michiganensis]
MTLPANHSQRYVYHFTHIDNLESLFSNNMLSNNELMRRTTPTLSIAEPDIQARRATMQVTCGPGGVVHDYVPFYFCTRSPMLLGVVNKRNIDQLDIIYLEFKLSKLINYDFVFTDSSANAFTPPNFYDNLAHLDNLEWDLIDSLKWAPPTNKKQQKMAEFLVYNRVSISDIENIVVWNEGIKERVKKIAASLNVTIPTISFEEGPRWHYYTNFMNNGRKSCSPGPKETNQAFKNALTKIHSRTQKISYEFNSLDELITTLRTNISNINYTNELVGLHSENALHRETVAEHTLTVISNCAINKYYLRLNNRSKIIVELAAFLHDIGKGPKSRWPDGTQKVDARHPLLAMPMLEDLIINRIKYIDNSEIEHLLKLVCYHDLIGDILGQGRDEKQLLDLVKSENELNMLFCLSEADVRSLNPYWWREGEADAIYQRALANI